MRHYVAAGLGLMISFASLADEADLNISNRSVNGQLNFLTNSREVEFGGGYVYRKGGTNVANLDMHARGQTAIGNLPTTVGVGARLSTFQEDDLDGTAVGLGGYAHVKVPEVPGLGFKAGFHLAPAITSFSDIERFYRTDIRATYRVIQSADIYGGYRSIRAKIESGDEETLDESFHLGFTLFF